MGGKAMQRFVAGGLIEIPPGPPKPPEGSELGVQDRPSSVAPSRAKSVKIAATEFCGLFDCAFLLVLTNSLFPFHAQLAEAHTYNPRALAASDNRCSPSDCRRLVCDTVFSTLRLRQTHGTTSN